MSKKTVHNTNCCVFGCHSRKNVNRSLHFHYFPKKGELINITNSLGVVEKQDKRKLWEKLLLMGKPATPAMRACSLHFKQEDYLGEEGVLSSRLKKSAVPSMKLPEQRFSSDTGKSSP